LKRKLDHYEKMLLEKEIQLRIALDQIELLQRRNNTNDLFDRLDKEKEQEKMQRMLNKGDSGNDQ